MSRREEPSRQGQHPGQWPGAEKVQTVTGEEAGQCGTLVWTFPLDSAELAGVKVSFHRSLSPLYISVFVSVSFCLSLSAFAYGRLSVS